MTNYGCSKTKIIALLFFAYLMTACAKDAAAPAVSERDNRNSSNSANQNPNKTQTPPGEDKQTAMHKRLDALVGDWNVEKSLYFALGGTAEKPFVSTDLTCRREWIAETGKTFLKDVTEGTFGGAYYRLGILGYSPVDNRYEWNTVDNFNPIMMTYKGAKDSAKADGDISINGEFTDPGIIGKDKEFAGKTIAQRTVIKIESPDKNIMEIYFTPPGKAEFLADRAVYTRRK